MEVLYMYKINLDELPEEARRELLDFYEFLVKKYKKTESKNKNIDEIIPRKVKPFKPLKRDEIYNLSRF